MQSVWDDRKNRANQRKHGISFETATLAFDDPDHISTLEREVEGELRWQTIGMVRGRQILLVAHTVSQSARERNEEVIRIISARKATRQERSIYAQGF